MLIKQHANKQTYKLIKKHHSPTFAQAQHINDIICRKSSVYMKNGCQSELTIIV